MHPYLLPFVHVWYEHFYSHRQIKNVRGHLCMIGIYKCNTITTELWATRVMFSFDTTCHLFCMFHILVTSPCVTQILLVCLCRLFDSLLELVCFWWFAELLICISFLFSIVFIPSLLMSYKLRNVSNHWSVSQENRSNGWSSTVTIYFVFLSFVVSVF